MANNNYGPLKILTKDKTRIISLDPKDIAVEGNCIYAYPRNKAFAEVDYISRILLGEYRERLYAMEAILQIFNAITSEKVSYAMPDETVLESIILKRRKSNMSGVEDAVVEDESYTEEVVEEPLGYPAIYVHGKMCIEDAGKNIVLEMRASKNERRYSFFVYDEGGFVLESYENVVSAHEYCVSRYNVHMKKMHMVAEEKITEHYKRKDSKEGKIDE